VEDEADEAMEELYGPFGYEVMYGDEAAASAQFIFEVFGGWRDIYVSNKH
jgi:hypothetical protein